MKSTISEPTHKSGFAANACDAEPVELALLTRARDQLSWRLYFRDCSAAEQEAEVHQEARGIALTESEIGKSAARIDAALNRLHDEVRGFLKRWPDEAGAEAATIAALTVAGLSPRPDSLRPGNGPDCFRNTVEELRIWQPVLNIIWERLGIAGPVTTIANSDSSARRGL